MTQTTRLPFLPAMRAGGRGQRACMGNWVGTAICVAAMGKLYH
jgi:hypothetical protein